MKWLFAFVLCFIPLFLRDQSAWLMAEGAALVLIAIFFMIFARWQGYYVFGIQNEPMKAALLQALKKMNIGYEEHAAGAITLPSEGGEIFPLYGRMRRGTVMILARNLKNKDLLKNVVSEINLYLQDNPCGKNTIWFIINLVFMAIILGSWLFFFMHS